MAEETLQERIARMKAERMGGVAGAAPAPASPSGGGGIGFNPFGFLPDKVKHIGGTVLKDLFSAEEALNTPFGDLGTAIRTGLEKAPVVGGALGVGFDVGLAPINFLAAGTGAPAAALGRLGRVGKLAGKVIEPIGGKAGSLGFNVGAEVGATLTGVATTSAVSKGLKKADEHNVPLLSNDVIQLLTPLAVGIGATALSAAGAKQALETIPTTGPGLVPLQKMLNLLQQSKKKQPLLDTQRAAQMGRKGAMAEAAAKLETPAGSSAELGAQQSALAGAFSGKMARGSAFQPLEDIIDPDEVADLTRRIDDVFLGQSSSRIAERKEAREGYTKVLLGQMPTPREIKLLEEAFGSSFGGSIRRLSGDSGFLKELMSVANAPRALMASMDLSASLRQGGFFAGKKAWRDSFAPMWKALRSEEGYRDMQDVSLNGGVYPKERKAAGIFHAGDGKVTEEEFKSDFASGLLPGVRTSERAYVAFLNKLRADTFDQLYGDALHSAQRAAKEAGEEVIPSAIGDKAAKRIANFVNSATGRGRMPAGDVMDFANTAFFSPRYLASRIQLPIDAMFAVASNPGIRREVTGDVLRYTGGIATGLAMIAQIEGIDVEQNPTSAEFGKVKIGNTRFDVLGGYSPLIRGIAQVATGERKSASGDIYASDTKEIFTNLLRSKLAPVPGAVSDVWQGKNFIGEPVEKGDEFDIILASMTPLLLQEINESVQNSGARGAFAVGPAFLGIGSQSYTSVKDAKNDVSMEKHGKEWDDLSPRERSIIEDSHKDTFDAIRKPSRYENQVDVLDAQKEAEYLISWKQYQDGTTDVNTLRDALDDIDNRMRGHKAQLREDEGFSSPIREAEETSRDEYFAALEQAKILFPADYESQQDYLEQSISSDALEAGALLSDRAVPEGMQGYFDAKAEIKNKEYWDAKGESFDRVENLVARFAPGVSNYSQLVIAHRRALGSGDRVAAAKMDALIKRIDSLTSTSRRIMRLKDPDLDSALGLVYGSTPVTGRTRKGAYYDLTPPR